MALAQFEESSLDRAIGPSASAATWLADVSVPGPISVVAQRSVAVTVGEQRRRGRGRVARDVVFHGRHVEPDQITPVPLTDGSDSDPRLRPAVREQPVRQTAPAAGASSVRAPEAYRWAGVRMFVCVSGLSPLDHAVSVLIDCRGERQGP